MLGTRETMRGAGLASGCSGRRSRYGPRSLPRGRGPPSGRTLVEEGADSLLRVPGHHVARHDRSGVAVRVAEALFDLPVERALAGGHGGGRLGPDGGAQLRDAGIQLLGARDPVDEGRARAPFRRR